MNFLRKNIITPPLIVQKLFRGVMFKNKRNKVILTIDDSGNNPSQTLKIVDLLQKHRLKAIFFLNQDNSLKFSQTIKILNKNSQITANHCLNHSSIFLKKYSYQENQILANGNKFNSNYFRPPYGRFDHNTLKICTKQKLKLMLWSLFTYDFLKDIELSKKIIANYLKRDSIAVFHDNFKTEKIIIDILEYFIDFTQKKGYEFEDFKT